MNDLTALLKPGQFRAYGVVETKVVDELVTGLGACRRIMGESGKPIMMAVPPSIYPELEAKIRDAFSG